MDKILTKEAPLSVLPLHDQTRPYNLRVPGASPGEIPKLYVRSPENRGLLKDAVYLGLMGRRSLTRYQEANLRDFLCDFLEVWRELYPALPLVLLSTLHEGASELGHRTAMDFGFPTVGVLPTPINRAPSYPALDLINQIVETNIPGNAIISAEKPVADAEPATRNFESRERLMAWASTWLLIGYAAESDPTVDNVVSLAHRAKRPIFAYRSTMINHQIREVAREVRNGRRLAEKTNQKFYNLVRSAEAEKAKGVTKLSDIICELAAAPTLQEALHKGLKYPELAQTIVDECHGYWHRR